jgi:hypothetical protein
VSFSPQVASGHNAGSAGDAKPQTGGQGDDDDDDSNSGLEKLRTIGAGLRAKDPKLSPQQATALAMRTPEGAKAAMQDRQARLGKITRLAVLLG